VDKPGMVLKLDDFAAFEASWEDKVTSIRRIAQKLSLGLDAFVFLDDNPLERAWVRSQLPDVAVVELGDSPATHVRALAAGKYFEVLDISEEDRRRAEMYRRAAGQDALRAQAASLEEFLGGLHMRAAVRPICDENLKRVTQLINKTNQFNLTTRRYTEAQVRQFMTQPGWSGVFDLSDRFGDHGIVGVMLCRPGGQTHSWEIDTWLMSCRVLGRQLERLMLDCAVAVAREQGLTRMTGIYRPTAKNALVADLFASLGFVAISHANEEARYELDLTASNSPYSTFIDLVPAGPQAAGVAAAHEA
jgi:FkbH-like protein